MPKRKRRSATASPAKRTKSASAASRSSTDDENQPFRFLDLPPELRTEILSLAARRRGKALLNRYSRGKVSTNDALGFANKQVLKEYLGVLYQHARTTMAHVVDFDFRHIVTYYNKLNEAEKRALPTGPPKNPRSSHSFKTGTDGNTQSLGTCAQVSEYKKTVSRIAADGSPVDPPRRLKVRLDFSPHFSWRSTYLLRWLRRLEAEGKTGTNAAVHYSLRRQKVVGHWENIFLWDAQVRELPLSDAQQEHVKRMKNAIVNARVDAERASQRWLKR